MTRRTLTFIMPDYTILHVERACGSVGRALQSHCRGQGFKSPQVHTYRNLSTSGKFSVYSATDQRGKMEILENKAEWEATYCDGFLAHYEAKGELDFKQYKRVRNQSAPGGKGIDLSASRLVVISTAGFYLHDSQIPFDAANKLGDYSIRLFPSSTPASAVDIAHEHYDHKYVKEDLQVLLPMRHLEAMVEEGIIGEIAPSVVNFSGYQPDVIRVVDEMIPQIMGEMKKEQVNAALLVPS